MRTAIALQLERGDETSLNHGGLGRKPMLLRQPAGDRLHRARTLSARNGLRALVLLLALGVPPLHAQAAGQAGAITFAGTEFLHRWSKEGQHEFTPRGDEDLRRWREMVTIDVHRTVSTGEQLADVANRVLGNYQSHGKILRTDSKPRTPQRPAEHLIVAVMGNESLLEAAFARFMLLDGVGAVVVYSRRFYGNDAAKEMGGWLESNGAKMERALMSWDRMPSIAVLNVLPQSK